MFQKLSQDRILTYGGSKLVEILVINESFGAKRGKNQSTRKRAIEGGQRQIQKTNAEILELPKKRKVNENKIDEGFKKQCDKEFAVDGIVEQSLAGVGTDQPCLSL